MSNITSISLWIISSQWGYLYSQLYKYYSSSPSVNSPWIICYLGGRGPINSQCCSVQMSGQAGSWFMELLDTKDPCIQGRHSSTQWIQAGPEILIFHNLSEFYFFLKCACSWTIIHAFFFFFFKEYSWEIFWKGDFQIMLVECEWFANILFFMSLISFHIKPNNLNTCVICL